MSTSLRRQLLASTLLIGGLAISGTAFAQAGTTAEASPDVAATPDQSTTQEVVVTGSRIARPNLEQSSPVNVIGEQELSLQQPVNAEEFLRDLPGTVPGVGSQVNNGANGSATVNLRGLGTNRNLVLLNGRRIVPATLASVVDTNVIPVALLQRVDVFTGGASSAYGADAVSGVVNFITRRDFSGVNLSANYGLTERGDGRNYRADLLIGANFDDGKGNVVLGIGYNKTLPVYQGERAIGRYSRASTSRAAVRQDPRFPGTRQGSATSTPASIFFPIAQGVFDPATGTINTTTLGDYNFNPINVFQTPLDKYNIFAQGHYEVSPAIEVFGEALFSRTEVNQIIAPSGSFTNTFGLPLNNQFLTPAQRTQLCNAAVAQGASSFTGSAINQPAGAVIPTTAAGCAAAIASGTEINAIIARRFTEAGPRLTNFRTNTFQVTGGARGPLTSTLNWEVSFQYGESDRTNTNTNQGLFTRFQQAIRNCPSGSAPGCTAINIFGGEGSLTPTMFNFLNVATSSVIRTELGAAQASINGDFGIASPFADEPIGIAIGGEYRRYAGSQRGDVATSTPGEILGSGGAFTAISGEYDSKEVFAEVIAPLVEDKPFIYNLTVEAGARYSDYSTSGGNWTYKVGGSYSPIRDVKFRGVYSKAVRAPNLGELFAPVSTGLVNRSTDPCQGTRTQVAARGANFVALCEAQLVAVGLPASRLSDTNPIAGPIAGQIQATSGGNPNLDPEKATTYTAGVVVQPSFLQGFSATFDWFRIKVTDAISAPSQSDIIDGCFAQSSAASPLCTAIFRNPLTGSLSGDASTTRGPILTTSNLGRIETEGYDFGFAYQRTFGAIRTNSAFNGNRTTKSRFQANPAGINRECVGYYSPSCDPVLPKWTWNARLTLGYQDTDVSLQWRHIGKTRVEPVALPAGQRPALTVPQTAGPANVLTEYSSIEAREYFDLSLQQGVGDNVTFTFLVENLLDNDPPDVGNTVGSTSYNSGNTFPSTYDALGRRYRVAVNFRF